VTTYNPFSLYGKVAIVTGGAGLLGEQHCIALQEAGALPIIWDIDRERAKKVAVAHEWAYSVLDCGVEKQVTTALESAINLYGAVDILVNNIANDPKVGSDSLTRLEDFPLARWYDDIEAGLTTYYICSKVIGSYLYKYRQNGCIINLASDLSVIAPDQRLYQQDTFKEHEQPVKPITYSVIKHGIVGLTKWLATYFAPKVRVNAISPGGVFDYQDPVFVERVSQLIPMGRMANRDEIGGALVFLASEASQYITGINLLVDGGRTIL